VNNGPRVSARPGLFRKLSISGIGPGERISQLPPEFQHPGIPPATDPILGMPGLDKGPPLRSAASRIVCVATKSQEQVSEDYFALVQEIDDFWKYRVPGKNLRT